MLLEKITTNLVIWNNIHLSYSYAGEKSKTGHREFKVLAGLCSFLQTLAQKPRPCLFQLLEAAYMPQLMASILYLHSQQWQIESFPHGSNLTLSFHSPLSFSPPTNKQKDSQFLRIHMISLDSLDNPEKSPYLNVFNLDRTWKSLMAWPIIQSQILGIQGGYGWRADRGQDSRLGINRGHFGLQKCQQTVAWLEWGLELLWTFAFSPGN